MKNLKPMPISNAAGNNTPAHMAAKPKGGGAYCPNCDSNSVVMSTDNKTSKCNNCGNTSANS